jgi:hypothetical protein
MRISTRLRQDPILLATTLLMALGILIAVGLMIWWTFALIPLYPPRPCAPDAKAAIWFLTSL